METLKLVLTVILILVVKVGVHLAIAAALIGGAYWVWRRLQRRDVHPRP
jgi:hypothetical protein